MTLWYSEYGNFNQAMGIMLWAITFGDVKKFISHLIILVILMGCGGVWPSLGGLTSKVLLLGATFFLTSKFHFVVENIGTIDDI